MASYVTSWYIATSLRLPPSTRFLMMRGGSGNPNWMVLATRFRTESAEPFPPTILTSRPAAL